MILVTVGTSEMQFNRMVLAAKKSSFSKQIVIQYGVNFLGNFDGLAFRFLSRNDMRHYINRSDLVVSHAGIGSILDCIVNKKKILLVERKINLGESKANQMPAIDYFKDFPNIYLCNDLDKLDHDINECLSKEFIDTKNSNEPNIICNIINEYLQIKFSI